MKVFIVILVIVNIAFAVADEDPAAEAKKKAEEYIQFCKDDTGISDEDANRIKVGDFSVRDEKAQVSCNTFVLIQAVKISKKISEQVCELILQHLINFGSHCCQGVS